MNVVFSSFFSLFGYCICLFGHFSHFRMKNESNQIKWSHKAMCPCVYEVQNFKAYPKNIPANVHRNTESKKVYIYTYNVVQQWCLHKDM